LESGLYHSKIGIFSSFDALTVDYYEDEICKNIYGFNNKFCLFKPNPLPLFSLKIFSLS